MKALWPRCCWPRPSSRAATRATDPATAKGAPPAVPVTVAEAAQRDVPVQIRAIGNVQALATVSAC